MSEIVPIKKEKPIYKTWWFWVLAVIVLMIIGILNLPDVPEDGSSEQESSNVVENVDGTTRVPETSQPAATAPTSESTFSQNNAPAPSTTPTPSITVSQKNAVQTAKSYLAFGGFSRDGLVDQLEYEKFSHDDAVYGVDHSGADWNEQAAKSAKSYMEFSSFSRDGLIEQLKYEKFTQAQAEYGANAVGL
ncbi:hypothetical protein DRH29_00540 [candidate division Kazan bacterium]|uniref:Putative host cell surface-exposed lipoprotein Ltp-like HTH region domain-containing protein n=1 Tax=candidate division Kazan bacterium TaxID=2202143 RepID=A0A420ZDV9_UNCK3|nr:MAG: hypothetical protein DRH29_00540 [candidate division Kazan bacterium]